MGILNKKNSFFFFLSFLLWLPINGNAQCVTNVDFNTWVQEGDPADGDWVVTGGGSQVEQNINGAPTFYVSPDNFINVVIEGTIQVNTSGDDDYVGFVFGYQQPVGNVNTHDYWLFDWKQGDQSNGTCTGEEGMALNRVNGTIDNADIGDHFFCHNNGPEFQVLDSQWGAGQGWNDFQVYDFTLVYTSTRAVILVDNDTIFDEPGCYQPGRFGFYNYSQSEVIYSGFQYQLQTDFQILTGDVCMGDTAEFLFADTSCTNIAATIDSTKWDFGDGNTSNALNPDHVYSSPGTYNVQLVVTDDQGCKDTVNKSIRVYDLPTADFTTDTVCFANPVTYTDLSIPGDTAIENWDWDFGDGNTSTLQGPQHTYADSGNYAVELLVVDTVGCKDSVTRTIYQPPELSVAIPDTTHVSCFDSADGSAVAAATGGTPPYSYSWDSSPVQNNDTLSSVPAGTYAVEVTDLYGCIANDTVTITEPPELVISNFNVDSADCPGSCDGAVSAFPNGGTVSGQYQFYWSNGIGGINEAQPGNVCAGNYSLTIMDDNGCTVDTTFDLYDPQPFYVETSSDSAHCYKDDGAASVDSVSGGTGGYSYQWDANAGNQTGATAIDLAPGTYDVTITDSKGCDTVASVTVPNVPGQTASISSSTNVSCNGGTDGSATVQVTGGTQPYTYQWDDPASQTTANATGLSAGTYTVVVEDSVGCLDSVTVTINEPTPVQVSLTPDTTICQGGTATLTANASGGTPGYTYNWDQGLGTGQSHNVSPSTNTTYQVYAEDANGCTSAAQPVTVEIYPDLNVMALSDDSICPGETVSLSAIAMGGSSQGYSYSWSNGDQGPSTIVSPSSTTTYTVTLEDNCNTPPATDTVEIYLNGLPDVQFSGTGLDQCSPANAVFTNDTDPSMVGSQCLWDFGNGANASGCDQIGHTYTEPGCYDVTLTVRSPEGCIDSLTKPNMVCVRPYPEPDFDFGPQPTTVQESTIDFTNLSTGASDYRWDFGGLDTSDRDHPSFQFPNTTAGTYEVCLKATNTYGCSQTECDQVIIDGEFIMYVPNAFTPDGDGLNDEFGPRIQGADPQNYSFFIYDRWGEIVFETHSLEEKWDGSVKGVSGVGESEVYVWKVITQDKFTGRRIERTGHVTLIE